MVEAKIITLSKMALNILKLIIMTIPVNCDKLHVYSYSNQDWRYWRKDRNEDNNGPERIENTESDPYKYAKGFLTKKKLKIYYIKEEWLFQEIVLDLLDIH